MPLEHTEPVAAKPGLQTSESMRIAVRKSRENITGMMMYILLQRLYVRKNTSISSDGHCDVQEMRCTPLDAPRDRMNLIQTPCPLTPESDD
jgi:hypothetical protein